MKERIFGVVLTLAFCTGLLAEAYENQEVIDRPKSQSWLIFLDFNIDVFHDLKVNSYSVSGSTFGPDPEAPFRTDNDNDIGYQSNSFLLGVNQIFLDKGDYGTLSWYAGVGTSNVSLDLFPSGTIGTRGWILEGGVQGDIMKFGQTLDKGIEIDVSAAYIFTDGSSNGAVDEEYDLGVWVVNAAAYLEAETNLIDTSDTFVYVGAQISYAFGSLNLQLDAGAGSGEGDYSITNQSMNMLGVIVGTKFYWDSDRTTADIRLVGALDGSYSVGLRIMQTF
ncbi:hypothetical protein ACFL4W_00665 [Planctomycetota bacterium]